MRRILVLVFVLCLGYVITAHAQSDTTKKPLLIFESIDNNPEPPGGIEGYLKYLHENIIMPKDAVDAGVNGTVYLSVVVQKDGSITDVKIKKDTAGHGCAEEAMRVIKNMPKWRPGTMKGQPVAVRFTIPVKFVANDSVK